MAVIDLDKLTVRTTNGKQFTGRDHAFLAWQIWRRFGEDYAAAAAAWRRMLENDTPDYMFEELVGAWIDIFLKELDESTR